ncbi:hypothetical protein D3C81_2277400 [compost metagenome]
MKCQGSGPVLVERTGFLRELTGLGGDQAAGLDHMRLVEVIQIVVGEPQQTAAQVVTVE